MADYKDPNFSTYQPNTSTTKETYSPSASSSSSPAQTTFASLSLHQYDRIRLLAFPDHITQLIRSTIPAPWPRGIQSERLYANSHEFKLRGNPWAGQGDEAMHARRLMMQIFSALWSAGWPMFLSTDISKKQTDKDTLIFRHQNPPPPPCDWMVVSFSRYDRVRLMDAPGDLREAMVAELQPYTQESRAYAAVAGTWEIKLRGNPWAATGEETMTARYLLLRMITVLERFGFTVYASIDQKATTQEHRSESDTWHCRRLRDWAPGSPIYHN